MIDELKRYFWNILIWLDQGANVVLLGGDPDETLSSVFGKKVRRNVCPICKFFCYLLNKIDPNHCEKSIEHDEGKDAVLR